MTVKLFISVTNSKMEVLQSQPHNLSSTMEYSSESLDVSGEEDCEVEVVSGGVVAYSLGSPATHQEHGPGSPDTHQQQHRAEQEKIAASSTCPNSPAPHSPAEPRSPERSVSVSPPQSHHSNSPSPQQKVSVSFFQILRLHASDGAKIT